MPETQHYVCGFAFVQGQVLLIHKTKPAWQAGKLNGVGGKIEPGELAIHAMIREFQEEAFLGTSDTDWQFFYTLTDQEHGRYKVHFFRAELGSKEGIAACTEEQLDWCSFDPLPSNIIPNLRWLVPMARDRDTWKPAYWAE